MKKKKKIEFSKLLVVWALVVTTACIICSYALAFSDHDSCQDVTSVVVSTCTAIAVSYEMKSLGEKHSRNKYGINEDGTRIRNGSKSDEPLG